MPGATDSDEVDFGRTAADYRNFRAGFPDEFFRRLGNQIGLRVGHKALDLGTGTGTIARGLATRGMQVAGIDPAARLLREAAVLDRLAGVDVTYHESRAEKLPFADGMFDLVVAGQCWHWFDRGLAAAEALRILSPGGVIVIAHFDWLSLPGNVVEATEALILRANPQWAMAGGTGIYPQWLGDLAGARFTELETQSFDLVQPYSHEAWRGRIRASAGVGASLDEAAIAAFDAELGALLASAYPDEPLVVPHRVWWVTGRRPK